MSKILTTFLILWSASSIAQTPGVTKLSGQGGSVQGTLIAGSNTVAPAASAIIEGLSTTKGLLVPRMTTAQMLSISSPANALLVFNTSLSSFYYYDLPTVTWTALGAALTNGSGTTSNGRAVNLGGTLTGNANINAVGNTFSIVNANNFNASGNGIGISYNSSVFIIRNQNETDITDSFDNSWVIVHPKHGFVGGGDLSNIGNSTAYNVYDGSRRFVVVADSGLIITNAGNVDSFIIQITDTAQIISNLPIKISGNITANNLTSGTYTPTITNVANVAASTAYPCQYSRTGNVVAVSGKIDIDATLTATSTQVRLTLPIASALSNDYELAGTGFCPTIAAQGFSVGADASNNAALIQFIVTDVANDSYFFSFIYTIF